MFLGFRRFSATQPEGLQSVSQRHCQSVSHPVSPSQHASCLKLWEVELTDWLWCLAAGEGAEAE